MKKVRNTNIEIMRFLLMAAILLWHVIVHGYDLLHIGCDGWVYRANVPVSLFLATLTLPATYCFVLISGYYGLHFRFRRFVELLLWCIIVSVGLVIGQKYVCGIDFSFKELWQAFFPITSTRWWFVTAYVQLWILSPFLNHGVEAMSKRNLIMLLLVVYCVSLFHMFLAEHNAGSSLFGLVFVYLLGRYLKTYRIGCLGKIKWIYLFSFVCFFGIALAAYELFPLLGLVKGQKYIFTFMGFSNPLIIIMAVCIFCFFLKLPVWENRRVNAMLAPSLFIYLITEGISGGAIYKMIANVFEKYPLGAIGIFISILLGCLFVGYVVQIITCRILDVFFSNNIDKTNEQNSNCYSKLQ